MRELNRECWESRNRLKIIQFVSSEEIHKRNKASHPNSERSREQNPIVGKPYYLSKIDITVYDLESKLNKDNNQKKR